MLRAAVDFTGCNTESDLHEKLKNALDFPEFYGKNPDALFDCLTGFMETPAVIEFKGVSTLAPQMQSYVERILPVFKTAREEYGEIEYYVSD